MQPFDLSKLAINWKNDNDIAIFDNENDIALSSFLKLSCFFKFRYMFKLHVNVSTGSQTMTIFVNKWVDRKSRHRKLVLCNTSHYLLPNI